MSGFHHPFHIVLPSYWPLLTGVSTLAFASSLILMFKEGSAIPFLISLTILSTFSGLWWRDVHREGLNGDHTNQVVDGLKMGMVLFIGSEVLFFLAWFWAFFHHSLVPVLEMGLAWPPVGLSPLNPFSIPLLNTAILLSSGVSVTWAHHRLLLGESIMGGMSTTIVLGGVFTLLQGIEYVDAKYSLADSAFGSGFFLATGFHGTHVLIGTLFLSVTVARQLLKSMSPLHHLGFEFSIWYWHFVDVVWLFLYTFVYWWSW